MAIADRTTAASNGTSVPATNVYEAHQQAFKSEGLPHDQASWVARAAKVAEIFIKDAAQRDIEQVSPFAEVALLKASGLTQILGPKKYGGGGQGWDVGYQVIREVAKGDGYVLSAIYADRSDSPETARWACS